MLDIGVGHPHWHERDEGIGGGELQPLRARPSRRRPSAIDFPWLYRFLNGPIFDSDGYIDGTCTYYALVQLKADVAGPGGTTAAWASRRHSYGLLYIDEQTYFTQRWRLAHPEDHEGLTFALVHGLHATTPALYEDWSLSKFWCPFRRGHAGARSRLAVSRQVILVNGEDPETREAILYSVNFTYPTIDRTWRWRRLPAEARYFKDEGDAAAEVVPAARGDSVYPQTVRLRGDMTIHLKGTARRRVGPVVSAYLPATSELVPVAHRRGSDGRPLRPFEHRWKFLPEGVFRGADQFSHFGVRTTTSWTRGPSSTSSTRGPTRASSRRAGPAPGSMPAARSTSRRGSSGGPPLRPPELADKYPPSTFNAETRLRIVRAGGSGSPCTGTSATTTWCPSTACPSRSS